MKVLRLDHQFIQSASKADIIGRYARAFKFPSYWQPNWDSFEACMAELIAGSDEGYTVYHYGFLSKNIAELSTYTDVLRALESEFDNFRVLSLQDSSSIVQSLRSEE